MTSMFASGFGSTMLGDDDVLPLDEAAPPGCRPRQLEPMEEDVSLASRLANIHAYRRTATCESNMLS
jgi:hypothetical protein